jgi:carbonic anhydrase/acetyltransferase-like protein (isoleucine patch superfamily)
MRKMTQAEFDALKRKDGYLIIPEYTDCTEIDFGAADRVIFGNCCTLGNCCVLSVGCKLGNWCKLGDGCKLGDWCALGFGCELGDGCELGNGCKLGDGCVLGNGCKLGDGCVLGKCIDVRATFEGGRVLDGLYVQIGNIGSAHRTAYFYIDKDGAMFVRAGCWFSGMDEFKARVKSVHGGTIYEAQYIAACAYAEAVLPLMLKESDAKREKEQQHSMNINDFLRKYRKQCCNGIQVVRPRVKCTDGYTVSVQAGEYHYCSPRADADHFDKVELGYPSDEDFELIDYAEDKERPCDTVYGYVPVELVDGVLAKHGGIVGADFSNDRAGFWK